MATWPCHVILLIIISNNISLSLPIVLTYHFFPDGSSFWYTKPHLSIIGNWLSFIALLKRTNLLSHYGKAHQVVIFTIIFTVILLFSHLLENNLPWFDSIEDLNLLL